MRRKILFAVIALAVFFLVFWLFARPVQAPKSQSNSSSEQQKEPDVSSEQAFDKTRYSLEDPHSLWVVVNKKRPLPNGFAPSDLEGQLRTEPSNQLKVLLAHASKAGHSLKIISGYRSQARQEQVYNNYVQKDGVAAADRYSARPRHSEHQTGLAVDLGNSNGKCDLEICFEDTPAGQWLKNNAHNYGFVIRYLDGKESVTGYQYEPWHLRYVGQELATELQKTGQTMEEFFGLPAANQY